MGILKSFIKRNNLEEGSSDSAIDGGSVSTLKSVSKDQEILTAPASEPKFN